MSEPVFSAAALQDVPALRALIESAYRGDSAKTGWTHEADMLSDERTNPAELSALIADPARVILMAHGDGAPVVRAASERIARAAREATDSVTVLLRLARAPELLECAPFSVAELAGQECQRYQPYTAGKPLTLVFVPDHDFQLDAPRELLAAAIGNLVRNACLYTLQGEVTVRLAGRALIVEDTGPGLPEAARARLLHQPIPAGLVGSSGTGLGLGLVQRICLHLGASLTFTPRPGGGSVLRIDFM